MTVDMYNQSAFLVIKIAYMYYIENYSQNEIAKALQISVTTVSRMLKKAKQERIVEFVICLLYTSDISLFINHLPAGQDTVDFSSENASGSTSQAANLIEAMEAGAELLLLDEDVYKRQTYILLRFWHFYIC